MAIRSAILVSTTFDVQGRRIREYKGVVRGITVRAPTISQGILGGLKSIIGGQIAKPVRAILRRQPNFEFRMVEVTGVDFAARRVGTDHGPVPYDFLILALGGETNYFDLDGIVRHGFGLKGVVDAVAIRNHVLRCFELAMLEPDAERRRALLTFVVVGGGPTGVEMAGALSELIRLVLVKDYPRLNIKDVRVLLLEATDRLLAAMPDRLREAAPETLWRKKHVEVRFGAAVQDFDGARITLKSGEVIPARTLIWAAGAP